MSSQGFSQTLAQHQVQQQVQLATLQQMQLSHLLEQSSEDVEEEIQKALEDNPALERAEELDRTTGEDAQAYGDGAQSYFDERQELGRVNRGGEGENSYEEWVADTDDEGDILQRQIDELTLTPTERQVMDYIASGLNANGYLTKDDDVLADELAIEAYLDITPEEVHRLVQVFQSFEPAGIAAHNPQECLSLQLRRKASHLKPTERQRQKALTDAAAIVENYLEAFARSDWDEIESALNLTEADIKAARAEILQCDPAPGLHLSAAQRPAARVVMPDFYLSVDDDDHIHIELARAHNPQLRISKTYQQLVDHYAKIKQPTLAQKEEYTVAKEMVNRAHSYIDNLQRRQETLRRTMTEIARHQRDFFLGQDDPMLLKPLKLQDVAERADVSISTISRAAKSKYVETYYGLYPLRYFFNAQTISCNGKPVSSAVVKVILTDMIEAEDPNAPMSDMQLTRRLNAMGYKISRRTIAKYRKHLSIANLDMRKTVKR